MAGLGDHDDPLLTALDSSSTTEGCSLGSREWDTQTWGRRWGAVTAGTKAQVGQSTGQCKLHLLML